MAPLGTGFGCSLPIDGDLFNLPAPSSVSGVEGAMETGGSCCLPHGCDYINFLRFFCFYCYSIKIELTFLLLLLVSLLLLLLLAYCLLMPENIIIVIRLKQKRLCD